MSAPFDYRVHLSVKHPRLTPEDIATGLGRTPKYAWMAGSPRTTPNGRILEGVNAETYCTFAIGEGSDGELARCLAQAVAGLEPCSAFLREIKASGGNLLFYAFWHPNGDTGEVFDAALLGKLAALAIDLGVNVYDDRDAPNVYLTS